MPKYNEHLLHLVSIYPSGVTEWYCLDCKRWLVTGFGLYMVLNMGDYSTSHIYHVSEHGGDTTVLVTPPRDQINVSPVIDLDWDDPRLESYKSHLEKLDNEPD